MAAATQALRDAEQALVDQVAYVAAERVRLREERQAEAAAASALQTWRHREAQLMASIAPRQQAVGHCRHACDDAEVALFEALERQRSLNRRKEKYGLLIEQLADSGS